MRTVLQAFLLLSVSTCRDGAKPLDTHRLLQAIVLPRIHVEFQLGFNAQDGFWPPPERSELLQEAAAIEESLAGDLSEARHYFRLGELRGRLGDARQAQEAFSKAADLFRRQVDDDPTNGRTLTELATALAAVERKQEAEALLRQAVQLAPEDWRCWFELGRLLDGKLTSRLSRPGISKVLSSLSISNIAIDEQMADVIAYEEVRSCYSRAIAAAPTEAELYVQRAISALCRSLGAVGRAQGPGGPRLSNALSNAIDDLEYAAKLRPNDYRIQEVVVLTVLLRGALGFGDAHNDSQRLLSQSSAQRVVREAIERLATIAASSDAKTAAGALEPLALVDLLMDDSESAEEKARRAVSLDPTRRQAWDVLQAVLAISERPRDLIAVCKERAVAGDSARNRLLMAKAYFNLEQFDDAEVQARKALELDPEDFTALVASAALMIKNRQDRTTVGQSVWLLHKAQELLTTDSPVEHFRAWGLNAAICFALIDNVPKAQESLHVLLKHDADDQDARKLLDFLEAK